MRPKPYTSTRVHASTREYIFRIAGKMRFCLSRKGFTPKMYSRVLAYSRKCRTDKGQTMIAEAETASNQNIAGSGPSPGVATLPVIGEVASSPAPSLRTLAELLHWCAPPASVLRVLSPLAEAGQLEADALAYQRKWEAIRGPAPVPSLDGAPVATASPTMTPNPWVRTSPKTVWRLRKLQPVTIFCNRFYICILGQGYGVTYF